MTTAGTTTTTCGSRTNTKHYEVANLARSSPSRRPTGPDDNGKPHRYDVWKPDHH
ncbi:MAG: hypothetical protein WB760_17325 [Xanthobacteraceae bacterium]